MEKDLPNWMGDIILMVSFARYIASYSLMKTERTSVIINVYKTAIALKAELIINTETTLKSYL